MVYALVANVRQAMPARDCLEFPTDRRIPAPETGRDPLPLVQPQAADRSDRQEGPPHYRPPHIEIAFLSARNGTPIDAVHIDLLAGRLSDYLSLPASIFANLSLLKTWDEVSYTHSLRVSGLLMVFGRHLRLEPRDVYLLGMSGLLHDIGKLKVPQAILQKQGALTTEEFALVKTHPEIGRQMLEEHGALPACVIDICLHHHERIDGTGYPERLAGAALSPFARMAAICDVFDAVTSVRPYKTAWGRDEAIAWMRGQTGHFDAALLEDFIACLSCLPGE
jgi:HD-GYP domain-containing protein (c-di-GMP phosphodiesterase class II)